MQKRTIFIVVMLTLLYCARKENSFVRDNPIDPDGNTWNPPTVAIVGDTVININDSLILLATVKGDEPVKMWLWSIDGKKYSDTTFDGVFQTCFSDSGRHIVKVKVLNDDVLYASDSCFITATLDPPVVTAMNDSTVNIGDTFSVTVKTEDNGTVEKYVWATGDSIYKDTTEGTLISTVFFDTGYHVVVVKVVDDDAIVSAADSCIITVTLDLPVVSVMDDTTVFVGDTFSVLVTSEDNGATEKYLWATGDSIYKDTTEGALISTVFFDTGYHVVAVKAVDDDGIESEPDSCVVKVVFSPSEITVNKDRVVFENGSLLEKDTVVLFDNTTSLDIRAPVSDAVNGGKIKFLWAIGSDGYYKSDQKGYRVDGSWGNLGKNMVYTWPAEEWTDITYTPVYTVTAEEGGAVGVRWAVCDDSGLITSSSFNILFNRDPVIQVLSVPAQNDYWLSFDYETGTGTLPVRISVADPDIAAWGDAVEYTFSTGTTPDSMIGMYSGKYECDKWDRYEENCPEKGEMTFNIQDVIAIATTYYRFYAYDNYGGSVVITDKFVAPAPPQ